MSPRHNLADCYLVDPTARLRVWTVTAERVEPECPECGGLEALCNECGGPDSLFYVIPHPVRVPAYTAAEAAQVAASMSGLPRSEWAAYFFIPTTHEEV